MPHFKREKSVSTIARENNICKSGIDRDHPGATKRGFMWVYHSVVQKMVFFEYQTGRSGKFPKENLKAFKEFLQTDGYSGYKQFELNEDIAM